MTPFSSILAKNWKIQTSEKTGSGREDISSPGYHTETWIPAEVPSTVLGTLVKDHHYPAPYFGTKMKEIPGEAFRVPWWYRCSFDLDPGLDGKTVRINFDGINYKANIYLNGRQVATDQTFNGAYRRINLNITRYAVPGNNILAVEVIPPAAGDFAPGFVDWNIDPPDRNMGIFREVRLQVCGAVSIENPFVASRIELDTLGEAALSISAELANHGNRDVDGSLEAILGDIRLNRFYHLKAGESREIRLGPEEFRELNIRDPQLWWPYQFGNPAMHRLVLKAKTGGSLSDRREVSFGIRDVEDYINDDGHRGFRINGKKILIKGAGWTDDLFLQDTHESLEAQVAYVRHMNLNCIRLEGIWGKDQKLYELCDRYGILMMVGWSCQWEHEIYLGKPVDPRYGGVTEPHEIALIARSWEDQVLWLRNHPAIFVWNVGSDKVPHPELEKRYRASLRKIDPTRPCLNSAGGVGSEQAIITPGEVTSEISGSSGMKMLGPYAYTPPVYWYTDNTLGGAFGFNTETCPGANVPPLESIRKMIPADHLWPVDEVWEYHCGKNEFRTLDRFREAIDRRYGKAENVHDFACKAQLLNYELMRPMFEAFQANQPVATGVIQWMLNSAWPNMYWQLYDSYLMPNGAFYGTKKACEPLHLLYDYGKHAVTIANGRLQAAENFRALIRLFDIHSREVFRHLAELHVAAGSAVEVCTLPASLKLTGSYFLDLRLLNEESAEVGNNFYWLSTRQDELDYEAGFENWAFHTPSKAYADHTLLGSLPEARLSAEHRVDPSGQGQTVIVTLENRGPHIAFFLELNLAGKRGGETILPVFWEDNYVSLLPGETRTIRAGFLGESLADDEPVLKLRGWNFRNKRTTT